MSGLSVGCLLLAVCVTAVTSEVNGYDAQVKCSQGLSACRVSDDLPMDPPSEAEEGVVDVRRVHARAHLCCRNSRECKLCLAVELHLHIRPQLDTTDDEGGGRGGPTNASVRVCCTESVLPVCQRVGFTLHPDALPLSSTTQLSLMAQPVCASYGSRALVYAHPSSSPSFLEVSMPSLDEVCSGELRDSIEECEVPRIEAVLAPERGRLELEVGGHSRGRSSLLCLQNEADGTCPRLNVSSLPLWALTSCMCLQAWWQAGDQTSRRARSCPFTNHTGALVNEWRNLSVSLALVEPSRLLWNLSGPCRLEAQVWPCRRGGAVPHHGCREIRGQRKTLSHGDWRQTKEGRWEISGASKDFDLRFPPCVMVKVNRMEHELGPFCVHHASRWRWTPLIIAMVPMFFLAVLILYSHHNKIKRWAGCWRAAELMHTVRGQALVLSPPDPEQGVCELVCGLGSLLRQHGLAVSVDQWSRSELCSLGPLPWLYAQLLRLERQGGGKVVLVLTQGALQTAQEWTRLSGGPPPARAEDRGPRGAPPPASALPHSDVFWASLACVAGDRRRGRAGERFLLVEFEACPVQLALSDGRLPELLEGLSLFHLPSQNQALLAALTRGGKTAKDQGAARSIKAKEQTETAALTRQAPTL